MIHFFQQVFFRAKPFRFLLSYIFLFFSLYSWWLNSTNFLWYGISSSKTSIYVYYIYRGGTIACYSRYTLNLRALHDSSHCLQLPLGLLNQPCRPYSGLTAAYRVPTAHAPERRAAIRGSGLFLSWSRMLAA